MVILTLVACILQFLSTPCYSLEDETLFSEIKRISVTPVICDSKVDQKRIMQSLEKQLASWGKVEAEDPKTFGKAKYLPVVMISMQLLTKATLAANQEYAIFGLAWEQTRYVDQNSPQLNEQIENNLSWMLKELQEKYIGTSIVPNFSISAL